MEAPDVGYMTMPTPAQEPTLDELREAAMRRFYTELAKPPERVRPRFHGRLR